MKNTICIFYFRQTERLQDAVFDNFLFQLPEIFKNDIGAYKHRQSAEASLAGKMLLKYALQQVAPTYTLQDVQLGMKDRPFISNDIDFNISHSGEYIICAIARNAKTGIDIEKHRSIHIDLFKKYFDENEWSEISSSAYGPSAFFDLWSIKESAIKCDGRGVEVLSSTHKKYDAYNQVLCDTATFHYQQMAINENYSCCVCSDQEFTAKLTLLSLADLTGL